MDYFTIVAPSYEEAVKKARKQYGDRLRIHSRKDTLRSSAFGFGKTSVCEITCYLSEQSVIAQEMSDNVDEVPEKSDSKQESVFNELQIKDDEETGTAVDFYLNLAAVILRKNDFSENYIKWCTEEVRNQIVSLGSSVTEEDLELILLDKIAGSVDVDYKKQNNPRRICVVLGSRGSGKTTCVAKLAATFNSPASENRRNVRIVTLDDSPAVISQLNKLASVLEISVDIAKHESELENVLNVRLGNELILVDTFGKDMNSNEPDYRLYGLMNVADQDSTQFIITVPATMKNSDIDNSFEQFRNFNVSGIAVTKLDETTTVGNVISVIHDKGIPVLFVSDGKKIPKDFRNATVTDFLSLLKGFRIDIQKVLANDGS